MNIQPTSKIPVMPKVKTKSKLASSWITTVIIVLMLAIAVLGIMSVKKYFETQQTSVEQQEINEFKKFVNENPDSLDARLGLAYSFQKAGRYDEAREQYMEVLSVEPKNQAALFNLAEIARTNKDYKDAETRYKELLKSYKYHVLGSVGLADVYNQTKRYDDAIKLMDQMIKDVPRIIDFHLVKAEAFKKKGDTAKAKAAYQQVLKYDPTNEAAQKALKGIK